MTSPKTGAALGLLIANRGEIALRIAQTASSFSLPASSAAPAGAGEDVRFRTIGLYTPAEAGALHVRACDSAVELGAPTQAGGGTSEVASFLDVEQIVRIAKEQGAWGVIPGYGFLSESPAFADAVEKAGLRFVGPTPEQLALFGDKIQCKELARQCGVPLLPGTQGKHASLEQVSDFVSSLQKGEKAILKAVAGGGGRGMRVIDPTLATFNGSATIREAYESCCREAQASFGDARVYAERYLVGAKHIEVQIVGDGTGAVTHLWDRECSVQRRHQKLIEIAPAPGLAPQVRQMLLDCSIRMAKSKKYRSLATFEYLVLPDTNEAFLLEVNPRIQVEHTV